MSENTNRQDSSEEERKYTDEEKQAFLDRLNRMNRAEYAAFVRDLAVDIVKDNTVMPLIEALRGEQVRREVAEIEARFPDYWKYRDSMINISKSNPNISAEQIYLLARQVDCEQSISNLLKPRGVFSLGTKKRITFFDGRTPIETESQIVCFGNFIIVIQEDSNREIMLHNNLISSIEEIG